MGLPGPVRRLPGMRALRWLARWPGFVRDFRRFRRLAAPGRFPLRLDNFTAGAADLLHLPFPDGGLASLSCLHTLEHVGLGRYGDALDPDGDRRAAGELKRVLAPGGRLLLAVPLGRPAIHFNAHRIYAPDQVRELCPGLDLEEFALIPDDPADGDLVAAPAAALLDRQVYGCGCFLFRRPA